MTDATQYTYHIQTAFDIDIPNDIPEGDRHAYAVQWMSENNVQWIIEAYPTADLTDAEVVTE